VVFPAASSSAPIGAAAESGPAILSTSAALSMSGAQIARGIGRFRRHGPDYSGRSLGAGRYLTVRPALLAGVALEHGRLGPPFPPR